MSGSRMDTTITHEDERELANLMLLAAATYSPPPQQTPNVYQAQDVLPRIRRGRVPAPLPTKKQLSPRTSSYPRSPRQATGDNTTRKTSVAESQLDGELLSPGGISLDDIVYLRAGDAHEGVFELALCIEDLS